MKRHFSDAILRFTVQGRAGEASFWRVTVTLLLVYFLTLHVSRRLVKRHFVQRGGVALVSIPVGRTTWPCAPRVVAGVRVSRGVCRWDVHSVRVMGQPRVLR